MEVGAEGAVVGMGPRGGGGGLPVGVPGPGALADARVGTRAGRLHAELLRGDGAGVQQTGDGAVQLLQQHLSRGGGVRSYLKNETTGDQPASSPHPAQLDTENGWIYKYIFLH